GARRPTPSGADRRDRRRSRPSCDGRQDILDLDRTARALSHDLDLVRGATDDRRREAAGRPATDQHERDAALELRDHRLPGRRVGGESDELASCERGRGLLHRPRRIRREEARFHVVDDSRPYMAKITTLLIDKGGVLIDNATLGPQYRRLLGEYLPTELGGNADSWAHANVAAASR